MSSTDRAERSLHADSHERQQGRRGWHETDARTKSDDVVEARRIPERSAEIAAVGEREQAGGHPCRRAAARAARALREIVRISRRAVHLVVGVRSHRELGNVRLADRNDASLAQPLDEDAVFAGHRGRGKIGDPIVNGKPTAGSKSLKACGRPCSGPTISPARQAAIGLVGQRETSLVVQLGDDGVDLRVDPRDAIEVRGHQLPRRDLAVAHEPGLLARAHEAKPGRARQLRHAACYGASVYAERAMARRPFARGHSGCFACISVCTVAAASSAERPWRFKLARARLDARHDRAVGGNERPVADRRRATARRSWAHRLERVERGEPRLHARDRRRGEERVVHHDVAREQTRRRPRRRTPVSPRVCVGPTTSETHADAAEIEHVVAIEGDVGLAAGRVLQQLGRHRRSAARTS